MKENNNKLSTCPVCIVPGSDGKMPLVGYNSPIRPWHSFERGYEKDFMSHDYIQERYARLIAECGINLITSFENDYTKYPEDIHKFLEWGEKYGFRVFVNDAALYQEMTDEEFAARIAEYGKYKSFAGVHVVDEPCNDTFPVNFHGAQNLGFDPMKNHASLSTRLNSYDNLIGYTNLLPYYYWMRSTVDDYRNYVQEYLDTCAPKVLSYDHYPFDDRNRKRAFEWFFLNLSVIREYAEKAGIPFWSYVRCGSAWERSESDKIVQPYSPTKWEFFWHIHVFLAFGCKGIEYYPLVQPYGCGLCLDGSLDGDREGILGADGEPSMWHSFVRQMNQQIDAVDTILMKSENKGVLALKDAATYTKGMHGIIEAEGYKELVSVSCRKAGVFVGCFDYEGKTALYVVNNDTKKCQHVTLNFDNIYDLEYISLAQKGKIEADKLRLTLGVGSAVLVVVSHK